jgi:hypothetical protein
MKQTPKDYLYELRRERGIMLSNLAPKETKNKYDPPFKSKMEFFTLEHQEMVKQHEYLHETRSHKTFKKIMGTAGFKKAGQKVATTRKEEMTKEKR